MDAPPTSFERERELAELRSRAYGRDADIHLDAAALARLVELEDLARADAPDGPVVADAMPGKGAAEAGKSRSAEVPASVAAVPSPAVPAAVAENHHGVDAAAAGGSADIGEELQPRRRWWRRMPTWTLIAAAAVGGLTLGLAVPALIPPHPEAVLRPIPAGDEILDFQMYGVQRESLVRYASYHGLQVWSADTAQGSACVIVTTEDSEYRAAGCTPEPLRASADLTFFAGTGPVPGLDLPEQSVVRFILRDGVVEVWVAPATEGA